jgi:hypothetical protein
MLGEPMTDDTPRHDPRSDEWLAQFLAQADGVAGTIHHLVDGILVLKAAVNIPPKVQQVTREIPRGKGMAGLAWERDEPVQTCNLKEDTSGDVRPGAKAVDAKGAIAIPVKNAAGEFVGVVGVAFADDRELDAAAVQTLTEQAQQLPLN